MVVPASAPWSSVFQVFFISSSCSYDKGQPPPYEYEYANLATLITICSHDSAANQIARRHKKRRSLFVALSSSDLISITMIIISFHLCGVRLRERRRSILHRRDSKQRVWYVEVGAVEPRRVLCVAPLRLAFSRGPKQIYYVFLRSFRLLIPTENNRIREQTNGSAFSP